MTMTDAELDRDYALLCMAVREAGDLAMTYFCNSPDTEKKSDGTDVSEADLAVDALLKQILLKDRRSYGWLSEETEDSQERLLCEKVWIVDPIDGTRSFLKESPEWVVSAALVQTGYPVLAAVYNPAKDEFFSARRNGGALLNKNRISVSAKDALPDSRIIASRSALAKLEMSRNSSGVKLVWINSIAYRLCLVAMGWADATISLSAKSEWDLAAAHLLVEEAGGQIATLDGTALTYNKIMPRDANVLAAGPQLQKLLLDKFARKKT